MLCLLCTQAAAAGELRSNVRPSSPPAVLPRFSHPRRYAPPCPRPARMHAPPPQAQPSAACSRVSPVMPPRPSTTKPAPCCAAASPRTQRQHPVPASALVRARRAQLRLPPAPPVPRCLRPAPSTPQSLLSCRALPAAGRPQGAGCCEACACSHIPCGRGGERCARHTAGADFICGLIL